MHRAIWGGLFSLVFIFAGTLLMGNLSGYEARELIKNSLGGLNTLCNTIVLASATILALLLTLLGISSKDESRLKKQHYQDVLVIAKLDTIVFIVSLLLFLIFNLPVTESDQVPANWFTMIYYTALFLSALISSALIVVVLMLYSAVVSIIKIVGLGMSDHPLLKKEPEEASDD